LGTQTQHATVVLPYVTQNGVSLFVHSPCINSASHSASVDVAPGTRTAWFDFDVVPFDELNSAKCIVSYELSGPDAAYYAVPADRALAAPTPNRAVYIGGTALSGFNFDDGRNDILGYVHTVGQTSPSYLMSLSAPPSNSLTVTFYSPFATFSPASLTFTPDQWAQSFTLTPTHTTPGTSPYGFVTYSVSGADALSYAASVRNVVSRIRVRPALQFGPLTSITYDTSAASWVSVAGDTASWDPFNLVIACATNVPISSLDTVAAAPYLFSPASLAFDPAVASLLNNSFSYRVNPRHNQHSTGLGQGTCNVVYYVLPRNLINAAPSNPALFFSAPYSTSGAPELTVLSQGQIVIDFPKDLRRSRTVSFRVFLSPAPVVKEVRIRPTAPNVFFDPPVLVFHDNENMVEAHARLIGRGYSEPEKDGSFAPFEISWNLDEGSDRYAQPGNTYHRDGAASTHLVGLCMLLVIAVLFV